MTTNLSRAGKTMTLVQASTILGVTPDTLRQQVHRGRLVAVKVGRDWFVTPREVARYDQQRKKGG